MEEMEDYKNDAHYIAIQRAADIKNLIESRGWKILQEELDILKTIELENLLRSSKYTDILSSQALIKAYGLINEIVDNLLQAGETADYEFKLIKKKK
jgi:hypothetical protein